MSYADASRRQFLRLAAAAVSTTALGEHLIAQTTGASATGIPTRMLGRVASTTTIAIGYGGLLPRTDRQAELAQLAATNDGRADAGADSVRTEQPLQIVGIGHRGAIQFDEDISLQEAG